MSWDKLKRNAVREFKRSPGKTGLLLALLPLAAYFIVPALWKKVSNSKTSNSPVAAVTEVVAAKTGNKVEETTTDWRELDQRMASDDRMRIAPSAGLRNPFQPDAAVAEAAAKIAAEEEQKNKNKNPVTQASQPRDINPAELGLHLTSTIVGSRIRMATINGKPYRENAHIPVPSSTELRGDAVALPEGNTFLLKTVARKFVVLEHQGKTYQLELNR